MAAQPQRDPKGIEELTGQQPEPEEQSGQSSRPALDVIKGGGRGGDPKSDLAAVPKQNLPETAGGSKTPKPTPPLQSIQGGGESPGRPVGAPPLAVAPGENGSRPPVDTPAVGPPLPAEEGNNLIDDAVNDGMEPTDEEEDDDNHLPRERNEDENPEKEEPDEESPETEGEAPSEGAEAGEAAEGAEAGGAEAAGAGEAGVAAGETAAAGAETAAAGAEAAAAGAEAAGVATASAAALPEVIVALAVGLVIIIIAIIAFTVIAGIAGSGKGSTSDASTSQQDSGTVSGNIQDLAKQLEDRIGKSLSFPYQSSTGDSKEILRALVSGKRAYTTCPTQKVAPPKGTEVDINPKVLRFLVEASSKTKVGINAITDKCHSEGSNHYKGTAIDLDIGVGNTDLIVKIAKKYGGRRNNETSHIHLDFPR